LLSAWLTGTASFSLSTASCSTTRSGLRTGANATIGGKSAAVTYMNALKIVAPALNPGKYGLGITTPDGDTVSIDASFTAS